MNEEKIKTEGETLLDLIEQYRNKNGASLAFIAEALGVTPSLLSKREKLRAVTKIKTSTAIRAVALFGVDPGTFKLSTVPGAEYANELAKMKKFVTRITAQQMTYADALEELISIRETLESTLQRVDTIITFTKNRHEN